MTPEQIYDELIRVHRIVDPVALPWGDRFLVGRWDVIHELDTNSDYILRGSRVAVRVLGLGNSWEEAYKAAVTALAVFETSATRLGHGGPRRGTGVTSKGSLK